MPGAGSSRLSLSRHRTPAIVIVPPSPCPEPVPEGPAEGAAAVAGKGQDRDKQKDSDLTKQSQQGDANATNRKRDTRSPMSDDGPHQPPNPKRRNRKVGNTRMEVDLRNCNSTNGFGPSHRKNLRSLPSRNSTPLYDDSFDDGDDGEKMETPKPQNGKVNIGTTPQGKKSKSRRNKRRNRAAVRGSSSPLESLGTGQNVEGPKPNVKLSLHEASGEVTEEELMPVPVNETAFKVTNEFNPGQNQDDFLADIFEMSLNPVVAERSPQQDPEVAATPLFEPVLELEGMDEGQVREPTASTPTGPPNKNKNKDESDTSTMSTETEVITGPGRKEDFTIEGLFEYLLPRAAQTRSSSQHLLADILRRENIFLIIHKRYREILENSYLMATYSTEDLFRQLLSTLKGVVQGELLEITRNYYEVLNILN